MDFICPTCNKSMPRDLLVVIPHTEEHIIDVVKKAHPDWIEKNGLCKRCYEYYKKQLHPDV
ncbi:MAG: hypothetical protein RAP41_08050 [Candidatus Orphnella occulta]|nr:hypothetical protein [Candidatus Orphnella occulta]MDP8298112.1 hypothetical protein [Candidatus Orphnella occulta]